MHLDKFEPKNIFKGHIISLNCWKAEQIGLELNWNIPKSCSDWPDGKHSETIVSSANELKLEVTV